MSNIYIGPTFVYIGRDSVSGNVKATSFYHHDEREITATEVAKMIRGGLLVSRISMDEFLEMNLTGDLTP